MSKFLKSINPYDNSLIAEYPVLSKAEIEQKVEAAAKAFRTWRSLSFAGRAKLMQQAAGILERDAEEFSQTITQEMGKPIVEARAEVEKCAWVCRYYAENAADFLADEFISTDAAQSFVRHDPLGVVLAVMPWNYPFWQVFRFATPTLCAGNTALLKHAGNVTGCAALIEQVFIRAGFPEHVFTHLPMDRDDIEIVLRHDAVRAVSLTGSAGAGAAVASTAGRYLKKSLLELGGSNAFIVLEDADLELAVQKGLQARMQNTGQSCIAAKRFILAGKMYPAFVSAYVEGLKDWPAGDPLKQQTKVGPLARLDLAQKLEEQIHQSVAMGAKLLYGGKREACFVEPTVLGEVTTAMPAFREETFGPLAAMVYARDEEEAYALAAESSFGLGTTVCTRNVERALEKAASVPDGAFFINELVKSDPRLPFGGTGESGYGRELGKDGIREFVNRKSVYIR